MIKKQTTAKDDDPNLFGTLLLLIALAMIIYVAANLGLTVQNIRRPQVRLLEFVWKQDLDNLASREQLPIAWNEIRYIEKIPANDDRLAKQWAENIAVPIEVNPQGSYKLEILFISQKNPDSLRAVVQHHITQIQSGNSVWELGRTYTLEGEPVK